MAAAPRRRRRLHALAQRPVDHRGPQPEHAGADQRGVRARARHSRCAQAFRRRGRVPRPRQRQFHLHRPGPRRPGDRFRPLHPAHRRGPGGHGRGLRLRGAKRSGHRRQEDFRQCPARGQGPRAAPRHAAVCRRHGRSFRGASRASEQVCGQGRAKHPQARDQYRLPSARTPVRHRFHGPAHGPCLGRGGPGRTVPDAGGNGGYRRPGRAKIPLLGMELRFFPALRLHQDHPHAGRTPGSPPRRGRGDIAGCAALRRFFRQPGHRRAGGDPARFPARTGRPGRAARRLAPGGIHARRDAAGARRLSVLTLFHFRPLSGTSWDSFRVFQSRYIITC